MRIQSTYRRNNDLQAEMLAKPAHLKPGQETKFKPGFEFKGGNCSCTTTSCLFVTSCSNSSKEKVHTTKRQCLTVTGKIK